MTVSENITKVQYKGAYSTGDSLPITFPYYEPENISVQIGMDDLWVYNVDYEVKGENVILKRDISEGSVITIYRSTPFDQQSEFPQNSKFLSSRITEALDKICLQQQEQNEQLERCIYFNIAQEEASGVLPTPVPDNVLKWDAEGKTLENYDILGRQEEFEQKIEGEINTVKEKVNQADQTAKSAEKTAQDAKSTAQDANERSQRAEETAKQAENKADIADSNADSALDTAREAEKTSRKAEKTAQDALDTVTDALENSEEALETAKQADQKADEALTEAQQANKTVEQVKDTVDSIQDAVDRVTEAAGKIEDLEGAITDATEAADLAQQAAQQATESVQEFQDTVDRVNDSLEDKADKTELDNYVVKTVEDGSNVSRINNEKTGGVMEFTKADGTAGKISLSDGSDEGATYVQLTAHNKDKSSIAKINMSTDGAYYLKQDTDIHTADDELVVKGDLESFALSESLDDFLTEADLEPYAKKAELPIKPYNPEDTYKAGDITVFTDEDGNIVFAKSLKDDNTGHSLEENEWWDTSGVNGSGSGFSLFDVTAKDHELSFEEKLGYEKLGEWVYEKAADQRYGYPDFYDKVIEEYSDVENTKEEVYSSNNFIEVGTLTKDHSKISGFSTANYIKAKAYFNVPDGLTPWEIQVRFKYNASVIDAVAYQPLIASHTGEAYPKSIFLQVCTGNFLGLWMSSNGNSWDLAEAALSTTALTAGKEYLARLIYNGGGVYLVRVAEVTDAEPVWATHINVNHFALRPPYIRPFAPIFGAGGTIPLNGVIDLKDCYININNEVIWRGVNNIEFVKNKNNHKFYNTYDKATKYVPVVLPVFDANLTDNITISDSTENTTTLQAIFNNTAATNPVNWSGYWININYGRKVLLDNYSIWADNLDIPEHPEDWKLYGYNGDFDGDDKAVLDTQGEHIIYTDAEMAQGVTTYSDIDLSEGYGTVEALEESNVTINGLTDRFSLDNKIYSYTVENENYDYYPESSLSKISYTHTDPLAIDTILYNDKECTQEYGKISEVDLTNKYHVYHLTGELSNLLENKTGYIYTDGEIEVGSECYNIPEMGPLKIPAHQSVVTALDMEGTHFQFKLSNNDTIYTNNELLAAGIKCYVDKYYETEYGDVVKEIKPYVYHLGSTKVYTTEAELTGGIVVYSDVLCDTEYGTIKTALKPYTYTFGSTKTYAVDDALAEGVKCYTDVLCTNEYGTVKKAITTYVYHFGTKTAYAIEDSLTPDNILYTDNTCLTEYGTVKKVIAPYVYHFDDTVAYSTDAVLEDTSILYTDMTCLDVYGTIKKLIEPYTYTLGGDTVYSPAEVLEAAHDTVAGTVLYTDTACTEEYGTVKKEIKPYVYTFGGDTVYSVAEALTAAHDTVAGTVLYTDKLCTEAYGSVSAVTAPYVYMFGKTPYYAKEAALAPDVILYSDNLLTEVYGKVTAVFAIFPENKVTVVTNNEEAVELYNSNYTSKGQITCTHITYDDPSDELEETVDKYKGEYTRSEAVLQCVHVTITTDPDGAEGEAEPIETDVYSGEYSRSDETLKAIHLIITTDPDGDGDAPPVESDVYKGTYTKDEEPVHDVTYITITVDPDGEGEEPPVESDVYKGTFTKDEEPIQTAYLTITTDADGDGPEEPVETDRYKGVYTRSGEPSLSGIIFVMQDEIEQIKYKGAYTRDDEPIQAVHITYDDDLEDDQPAVDKFKGTYTDGEHITDVTIMQYLDEAHEFGWEAYHGPIAFSRTMNMMKVVSTDPVEEEPKVLYNGEILPDNTTYTYRLHTNDFVLNEQRVYPINTNGVEYQNYRLVFTHGVENGAIRNIGFMAREKVTDDVKLLVDNLYDEYKVAWYYGVDKVNRRILLPRISDDYWVDNQTPDKNFVYYMVVGNAKVEKSIGEYTEVTSTENDTLPLFMSHYFDFKPNHVSWLPAEAVRDGNVYTTAYNELINVLSGSATQYGDGLKVIYEHDKQPGVDYSSYWIVDIDKTTFRTPAKTRYDNTETADKDLYFKVDNAVQNLEMFDAAAAMGILNEKPSIPLSELSGDGLHILKIEQVVVITNANDLGNSNIPNNSLIIGYGGYF